MYDRFGWIAQTSEHNLLIRYDGRGFGMSQRDVTDFSLDARVRDIEAVADALKLEHFNLYAISAGGPAAIAYAAGHPERLGHLILVATNAGTDSVPGNSSSTSRRGPACSTSCERAGTSLPFGRCSPRRSSRTWIRSSEAS